MAEEMVPPTDGQGTEVVQDATPVTETIDTPVATEAPAAFSWKDRLGEFKEDKTLASLPDDENGLLEFGKMFVNAQKLIGMKGIHIPSNTASQEEWNKFYSTVLPASSDTEAVKRFNAAFGVPEDITEYELDKINVPESLLGNDEDWNKSIKDLWANSFKEAGINKDQAGKMFSSFGQAMEKMLGQMESSHQAIIDEHMSKLTNDWGARDSDSFNRELAIANRALTKWTTDEEFEHLQSMGFDKDPVVARFMNRIGRDMLEDSAPVGGMTVMTGTPEWARTEIQKVLNDKANPYNQAGHPGHREAMETMQRLYNIAYPN